MYQYLITTTTDDDIPRLVVIGHLDSYIDHLTKYQRVSYYPGNYCRCGDGMRVAKIVNIAIVETNSRYRYNLVKQLTNTPFTTFGANLTHIDLQSQYPELFL